MVIKFHFHSPIRRKNCLLLRLLRSVILYPLSTRAGISHLNQRDRRRRILGSPLPVILSHPQRKISDQGARGACLRELLQPLHWIQMIPSVTSSISLASLWTNHSLPPSFYQQGPSEIHEQSSTDLVGPLLEDYYNSIPGGFNPVATSTPEPSEFSLAPPGHPSSLPLPVPVRPLLFSDVNDPEAQLVSEPRKRKGQVFPV
ncbi:hypothetical protein BS47DRAFT_710727 [Hydnum rufescens UP504]|uniref:Uncharacterized protein n=1 Tax=Hydnum rufescens UP504 TaxID=1448309 RepID=A0A9P6DZI0_9AGAM|nr:hypothetical protein BS47DRAFT_710727 [Hydnum rufescens UP504]